MPVIINAETGQAEDLPDPLATKALNEGTHHVALNDPEGNPVTAPYHNAAELMGAGYTQPTPAQLQNLLMASKASTLPEQAKAFAEGMGEGATSARALPGEVAAGANPKEIAARRAMNPGINQLGQMAGLAGSSLIPGVGEANILERLGGGTAKALIGAGDTMASKIGSAAVKEAITFMGLQSGDEVTKMVLGQQDPSAPVETALTHIGLSGLIGAGAGTLFGAVSPLWKAANETKLGSISWRVKRKGQRSRRRANRPALCRASL